MPGEQVNSVEAEPGGTAADAASEVLSITDLGVDFATESGDVSAVRGVSMRVEPGETLALVGESGSGKSTVALATMSLLSSNARVHGDVRVCGRSVSGANESELARLRGKQASMVFQEPATALDPLKRIGAQITEVIRNHRDVTSAVAKSEAVDLLRRVGLPDPEQRVSAYPFQLSGGQRQRVVIAMAIANRPRLLIADEPTTALDVTVQAEILDLLRGLAAETHTGVLLVTHNMGVVADFADRVAVMYHGQIVETGPVEDVLLRPEHDYTKKLLAAVPRLDTAGARRGVDVQAAQPARSGQPGRSAESEKPAETDGADRVVELDDVSVVFGRGARAVRGLDHVSVGIHAGETVALVGESGSGKSTAARVALGLIRTDGGRVKLFDHDFHATGRKARRALRSGIGVVLQDPVASLDARMPVGECIAEPLRIHRKSMSRADRARRVGDVLERVQLPRNVAGRAPRELSGGQRQRVSIARALALEPRLLVADEPTSGLDVSVQESVLTMLTELQAELGFACLFVSHDLAVVQSFARRVVVMKSGSVVEEGATSETLVHPETDYTRRLLAAVPVADPIVQRARRSERLALLASGRDAE
ncbi:ABC transporter ATP-binding protein [Spelaeicoccus albus]|uniref:Peptide/nickel transport system ATP-binding protein n=2 Tax=Spelaeicoccus albus TaxID=1280376 RepID=A0A7Z0A9Z6_9MICO|nr:ABC transporter ATP-binding protein [Spelaeicoccus albus]NYI67082.1 peptide/nickel transport system ATP-binding protein [Spelaeicoccus albus]